MNLCDIEEIRALLDRHGFHFSKSMGQNFLIDPAIPVQIAQAAGADSTFGILEIGPGIGCLTAELSRCAGKVASVELDRSLLPILEETLSECPNVEILSGDVLKLDLNQLIAQKFSGLTPIVCANLPYNISTPVLTKFAQTPAIQSVTVLIQREVAQRICAAPGDRACGAFSLLMQYRFQTKLLFDVPRECFYPSPKVTSSVMRCVRLKEPPVKVDNEAFFFRVIRGAFLLRRKTLVNSLASALPEFEKSFLLKAIETAGLPADIRGERLSLQDFARISHFLENEKE